MTTYFRFNKHEEGAPYLEVLKQTDEQTDPDGIKIVYLACTLQQVLTTVKNKITTSIHDNNSILLIYWYNRH